MYVCMYVYCISGQNFNGIKELEAYYFNSLEQLIVKIHKIK